MGNQFFDFLKLWTETFQQKKFRIEIWKFSFQICFRINFGLWEVVKRKIHKYAYLRIFCLTTSQSPKLILKADFK